MLAKGGPGEDATTASAQTTESGAGGAGRGDREPRRRGRPPGKKATEDRVASSSEASETDSNNKIIIELLREILYWQQVAVYITRPPNVEFVDFVANIKSLYKE